MDKKTIRGTIIGIMILIILILIFALTQSNPSPSQIPQQIIGGGCGV